MAMSILGKPLTLPHSTITIVLAPYGETMDPSHSFERLLQKKEQSIQGKRSPSVKTIKELIKAGKTLAAIGDMYDVSRQRIHQILNTYNLSVEKIRPNQGHGVKCPHCQNDRVHSHSKTSAGNDRFFCPSCKKTFTVLSKPRANRKKPLSNAERQRRFLDRKKNLQSTLDNPTSSG